MDSEELRPLVEDGDIGAGPSTPEGSLVRQRSFSRCEGQGQRVERAMTGDIDCEARVRISSETSPNSSLEKFWHRAGWLVLLLFFQSTSSVILEHFGALIKAHPIVIYFLTMLVGAGGNAGSQSTVLVVRQLAISVARGDRQSFDRGPSIRHILGTEVSVGARLAIVLFVASFVRCVAFQVRGAECLAICLSMLAIVFTSTIVGASLPLVLNRMGLDPAHAGAAIQVMMDIIGVTLTCIISCTVLGVKVESRSGGAPIVIHTAAVDDARLPGIQREVVQLNGFGSFVSGSELGG